MDEYKECFCARVYLFIFLFSKKEKRTTTFMVAPSSQFFIRRDNLFSFKSVGGGDEGAVKFSLVPFLLI